MSNLNRKLKKVKKALNVDKEQRVAEIVMFSDGPLPLDQTHGNLTIHHVRFMDKATKSDGKQLISENLG
jgi:hypothetical protein